VAKLVLRVKLGTELKAGEMTEIEVARIERDRQADLSGFGLRLAEAKQLTSALQRELILAQVTTTVEHRCTCVACGRRLSSKGHYTATFRSLFGDVPIRIRRLLTCPRQNGCEAKSFASPDLEAAAAAPELAYVTARYATLAPFGKVADLLWERLPVSGAPNAGTVRNRTMRIGEAIAQPTVTTTATPQSAEPVVVGLDGGYVRSSRHRQEERHFEVIAGKVIGAQGSHSRFAFARNSPAIVSGAFKRALAMAGVTADTSATVLRDGDAGLWRLQREALPNAIIVLDWWHTAVRFERALQAARGLGAADAHLAAEAVGGLERTKWRLWHGRSPRCRRKLAALCCWARQTSIHGGRRASGTPRQGAAGLPRAEPGSAGPLCRSAPEWRADLDRVHGEYGQQGHRQTHEQETADALGQGHGAALPRRANSGAERYLRRRLPPSLSWLPPRKRR
jgi:hypothetical protein